MSRILNFFKPPVDKNDVRDWVNNPNVVTVKSEEVVEVEDKKTGAKYSFYLAHGDDDKWYALTDHEQRPKFCMIEDTKDDAYAKGVEILNFYMEHIEKHGD